MPKQSFSLQIIVIDQLALPTSTLHSHDGVDAFSQFSLMKMVSFRDDQQKGYIIYLEFQSKFSLVFFPHPSIPPVTSAQGMFTVMELPPC